SHPRLRGPRGIPGRRLAPGLRGKCNDCTINPEKTKLKCRDDSPDRRPGRTASHLPSWLALHSIPYLPGVPHDLRSSAAPSPKADLGETRPVVSPARGTGGASTAV